MRVVYPGPMVLNEVELLLGIDLTDLATDVHASEDLLNLADLFLEVSEDGGAVEGAADTVVPVPAVLPKDFLVAEADEVLVAVALGDEEDELAEEHVALVDFLEILISGWLQSLCCS